MQRSTSIWVTLIALGCSGRAIEVGPAGGSSGATGAGGSAGNTGDWSPSTPSDCADQTPLPSWPDDSGCVAASDLPMTGTWHGYVENQGAPWDQLTLVITGASITGGVCGTLAIGAGPPPAPATDPNVGYPPGSETGTPATELFLSGYPLTISGTTDGTRVVFSVIDAEPYRGWCKLQSSYYSRTNVTNGGSNGVGGGAAGGTGVAGSSPTAPSCGCLPFWPDFSVTSSVNGLCTATDVTSPRKLVVDCGKLDLCFGGLPVCTCNASGCDAAPDRDRINFDLRFSADGAIGSNTYNAAFPTDFGRAQ
jgi:hypothetical protein